MRLLNSTLFLLISLFSYGQGDWQNGFVIKQNGDTLFGLIDNRDSKSNSKQCYFKLSENSPVEIFKPLDIEAFRYGDGRFYVSKSILENKQRVAYFFEFMVNGKLNLYHVKDNEDRYFVERDTNLYELKNTEKIVEYNGVSMLSENKEYLGQLRALMMDADMKEEVSNLEFKPKSLIDIAKSYHNKVCSDYACIVYSKKFEPVKINWELKAGVAFNKISFGKIINSDFAISEFVGSKIEFLNGIPWSEKLSLSFEVLLQRNSTYNFSAEEKEYAQIVYKSKDYTLSNNAVVYNSVKTLEANFNTYSLKIPVNVNFRFSRGKIQPFIGAGMFNMFIVSEGKDFVYKDFEEEFGKTVPIYHWGINGISGISFRVAKSNSINVYIAYERSSSLNINQFLRFYYKAVSVSVGYVF